MTRNAIVAILGLLIYVAPAAANEKVPCQRIQHEGARYFVCRAEPKRSVIRLAWKRSDGTPYALLSRLPKKNPAGRGNLLFALNAGMFHSDLRPVGLYVEQQRQHTRINTRKGPGNFHLRPNGVFYVAGNNAGVLESRAYLRRKPLAEFATQSGPMLVINGKLHPLFDRAEVSRKIRNGVGVDASGDVIFAIAEDPVSFASFGRLYRDKLKCPNALFLDGGSVPTLYAPALSRSGNLLPMGPMIAVYSR